MRHVLEHLNEVYIILKAVFEKALSEKGILYLKLPRADSWEARFFKKYWHGYDLPRHRIHFTSSGIKSMLKRVGFSCVHVLPEVVPMDIIRSAEYATIKRHLPKLDTFLMPPAQTIALMMSPFGPGRMIVIAKKGA